jgi:hypothetical protein
MHASTAVHVLLILLLLPFLPAELAAQSIALFVPEVPWTKHGEAAT